MILVKQELDKTGFGPSIWTK